MSAGTLNVGEVSCEMLKNDPVQESDKVRSDCGALVGSVLFSTLPYLFSLGFYVDDWLDQVWLTSSRQDFSNLLRTLLTNDPSMRVRPLQAIWLVMDFKAFGRQPMGYHIVSALVFSLLPAVIYLVLRELRIGRMLAFMIALVFGLLPHYSADRFWISAQQVPMSMILAGLGIYAMLRWRGGGKAASMGWLLVSIFALVCSILSYEVPLLLIGASLALIGFHGRSNQFASSRRKWWRGFALACLVLMAVGVLKISLQTRIHGHLTFLTRLGRLGWHGIVEAFRFNFWTYGLHLPAVVIGLYRHEAVSWAALAVACGLGIFISAYLVKNLGSSQIPSRRACLWLILVGFVIFALGYGLFFFNPYVDFSTQGLQSRVTIASALGASCILVGMVGIGCSLPSSAAGRVRAYAIAIGVICGVYSLVVSGLGFFWSDARSQQAVISGLIAKNVQSMPKGGMLLVDGFCRFSGPAVVFGTDWDTTAALQLTLGSESLRGDVVSPDLSFGDTAAVERTGLRSEYAYGPYLFVYNLQRKTLTNLPSKKAAIDYLSAINPNQGSGCPAGRVDDGAKIF